MSERTAAAGISAPPKTIEHGGKVYTVAPVLTHGTMRAVEAKLYQRAKDALVGLRDAMEPAEYAAELKALRHRYEDGEFAFESEGTLKALQTPAGAVLLLSCMMTADAADILTLLTERAADVQDILNEAMGDSFPKAPTLPQGRGKRNPGKKRGRR